MLAEEWQTTQEVNWFNLTPPCRGGIVDLAELHFIVNKVHESNNVIFGDAIQTLVHVAFFVALTFPRSPPRDAPEKHVGRGPS